MQCTYLTLVLVKSFSTRIVLFVDGTVDKQRQMSSNHEPNREVNREHVTFACNLRATIVHIVIVNVAVMSQ